MSERGGQRSKLELAVEAALARLGVAASPGARVGRWLVDFYIDDRRLVVECDGRYWHSRPIALDRDRLKNEELRALGVNVLRLPSDRSTLRNSEEILRLALSALN